MRIEKKASAQWEGNLKEGKGQLSTESGALKAQPYGFNTRFEDKAGANPEELIGAAHAGCFTMALSKELSEKGMTVKRLETSAKVYLEKQGEGFHIPEIVLSLKAEVPGSDPQEVKKIAQATKDACPVSKLLKAKIELQIEVL